jgi:hypothetical protein
MKREENSRQRAEWRRTGVRVGEWWPGPDKSGGLTDITDRRLTICRYPRQERTGKLSVRWKGRDWKGWKAAKRLRRLSQLHLRLKWLMFNLPDYEVPQTTFQSNGTRRSIIASYWAVILLTLPLWWYTTSIERLPLAELDFKEASVFQASKELGRKSRFHLLARMHSRLT